MDTAYLCRHSVLGLELCITCWYSGVDEVLRRWGTASRRSMG